MAARNRRIRHEEGLTFTNDMVYASLRYITALQCVLYIAAILQKEECADAKFRGSLFQRAG
jgi:hypothetical protein